MTVSGERIVAGLGVGEHAGERQSDYRVKLNLGRHSQTPGEIV